MLTKETIKTISKLLKIKETDLETAIKAEAETEVTIDPKLQTFTEDEITTLKNNEYGNGKIKGVEIAVKETKEKFGVEAPGNKMEALVASLQKKALDDAKIEPEKQVQEATEKLNAVKDAYKQLELKFAEKETEANVSKIRTEVFKHIPAPAEDGPALDQDEIYGMMNLKGYEFKNENGKIVTYKDGKQVVDKLSEPVAVNEVVKTFLVEKKLITKEDQPAGRGGKNGAATFKFATLSELRKSWKESGKSELGSEFSEAVQKAAKENPEFAMDK